MTGLNKIDLLKNPDLAKHTLEGYPNSIAISAKTGEGLDDLLSTIETELFETFIPITVRIPYQEGQLISLFHDQGQVERIEHGRGGVLIEGNLPGRLFTRFQQFINSTDAKPPGR